MEKYKPGEEIESDHFDIGDTTWSIQLYPAGVTEEKKEDSRRVYFGRWPTQGCVGQQTAQKHFLKKKKFRNHLKHPKKQ